MANFPSDYFYSQGTLSPENCPSDQSPLKLTRILSSSLTLLLIGLWLGACTSSPKPHLAQGDFVGTWVQTEVDSTLAAQYLAQEYSSPQKAQLVQSLEEEFDQRPLNTATLKSLSQQASVDFATLYFARRSLKEEPAKQVHDLFRQHLANLKESGPLDHKFQPKIREQLSTWKFLFIPGFHYQKEPHTGADFAQVRAFFRRMGLQTSLIKIIEDGRILENAKLIAEFIREQDTKTPLVLVSTSKGGPETLEALHMLSRSATPEDRLRLEQIVAWVSLGGLLRGTPLSDKAFSWPQRPLVQLIMNLQDTRTRGLVDLRTKTRTQRLEQMDLSRLPLAIHFVATPLLGQVSPHAKDRYLRLRRHGPNDGLTLLADSILPDSTVILAPGLDHFYLSPDINYQALALALSLSSLYE